MLDGIIFSPQTIIVSLDVESLYTNIDHQVGVNAVMYFLDSQSDSDRMHVSLLVDLLLYSDTIILHSTGGIINRCPVQRWEPDVPPRTPTYF